MKTQSQLLNSLREIPAQADTKSTAGPSPSASTFFSSRRTPFGKALLLILAVTVSAQARIPRGDPIVNQDENLLVNGNFQSKDGRFHPLRWKYASKKVGPGINAIVSREQKMESDLATSGTAAPTDPPAASLKIIDESGSDDVIVRSEKRLVSPGLVYDAAARVYQGQGGAQLYLEFWSADNTILAEFPSGASFANPSDDRTAWKVASVTGTAPAAALHVTVSIRSSAGNIGTGYWDNASLTLHDIYDDYVFTGRHELLIDDYRLESSFDVERVIIPPVKTAPLLVSDGGLESPSLSVATVLKDPGPINGYVMWYYSNGRMLQARSPDGLTNWTRPNLNEHYVGSSSHNNVSFPPNKGRITVIYDANEVNQARRFKALAHAGPNTGYFYWYSADGQKWYTPSETVPVLPYGNVSNLALGPGGKYIATTRQRTVAAATGATFTGDRMAFVSTGTNMVDWYAPKYPMTSTSPAFAPAVEGDQADDFAAQSRRHIECQVESMPIYPYQGMYIGFPTIFELTDFSTGINAAGGNGPSYPQIASSRDLRVWHRPNRSPIIPLSRKGGWDAGGISVSSSMVEDGDDCHVYYSGDNLGRGGTIPDVKDAKTSIARATWTRDRFVALRNAANRTATINGQSVIDPKLEGFVRTKVITFSGGTKLKINAKVNPKGSIIVTVLDENNVEKTGFGYAATTPITAGDYLDLEAPLGGVFATLANTPIKLKFYLRNADLYSFWIEN